MKILWFIENLSLGGQQTQSVNLIRRFKGFEKKLEIDVIYFNDGPLHNQFEEVSNLVSELFPLERKAIYNPFNILKGIFKYYNYLKNKNYDFVISNGIVSFGFSSIMKSFFTFKHVRLLGGPLVDIEPSYEKYFHNILPFHKKVDIVFFCEGTNKIESSRYGNKLKIFPQGVNIKMFYRRDNYYRQEIRKKYNILSSDVVIGWVGRIASNMEIKNTIKLGGLLKKRNLTNFKILIVGGGSWEKEMLQLIDNESINSNCIFLGWQPMELIPDLFQAMDIVPLLDDDPVGGSILREAMACGSLVISVDGINKTQSTFIKDRYNGCLVSDINYIEKCADIIKDYMINNREIYYEMALNGVRYANQNMSFDLQAKVIYEGMIND